MCVCVTWNHINIVLINLYVSPPHSFSMSSATLPVPFLLSVLYGNRDFNVCAYLLAWWSWVCFPTERHSETFPGLPGWPSLNLVPGKVCGSKVSCRGYVFVGERTSENVEASCKRHGIITLELVVPVIKTRAIMFKKLEDNWIPSHSCKRPVQFDTHWGMFSVGTLRLLLLCFAAHHRPHESVGDNWFINIRG